jgi:hypothetical protein
MKEQVISEILCSFMHKEPSSAAIKFRNRKQMSPIVFYGSPQGVPVKKPMSLLRLLREIRIDLKKQTDLISRCLVRLMLHLFVWQMSSFFFLS